MKTWLRGVGGCCVILAALILPGIAVALPSVSVHVLTLPMTDSSAPHTGLTGTVTCTSGTLTGGGSFLRRVANEPSGTNSSLNATQGLVLGGTAPSQGVADSRTNPPPAGATPYDLPVTDGTTDPTHWFTDSNFTGVAETGDQFATFGLCAISGGPAHTVVKVATTVGPNATQQVSPPHLTTATCPSGDTLIGGGAVTSTPDQFNDGVTTGNNGNLKPMASYPSDANGVMAANGSTSATSWSAYGSAGITSANDTVNAYAVCSTDPTTPRVQVARADIHTVGPQAGGLVDFAAATCPSGTQMIGGGWEVDEQTSAGAGLQPQQGWHMIGSFPATDSTGLTEVSDGATNPQTWSTELNSGGVGISSGQFMNQHAFAMCATPPPATAPTCTVTAIRRGPSSPSGSDEEDVTVTDPNGVASVSNLVITNGKVYVGGSSGTEIDQTGGTTFPSDPTSVVLTAVKTVAGTPTRWSFDATNAQGNTTHCA